MNRFLTNKKLIILLISVIIFISLLTLSLNTSSNNRVQGVTNDFTAFVGRIFSKPTNAVMNAFDSIEDVQHTFEENQILKRDINKVYEKDAEIATLKEENQQLKNELDIESTLSEYGSQTANVISRNPDQWVDNLVIDAGSNSGVKVDMPVMSQNGLIGIISEVNHSSSKVTLLTNIDASSNRVSAQIITTGESSDDEEESSEAVYGIISEYRQESEELLMTQVTTDENINEGDLVSTSGLGGLFPSGLLIGTVKEIALDNQGLGQIIYIDPATDFNTVRVVTVVEREAETIKDDSFEEGDEE